MRHQRNRIHNPMYGSVALSAFAKMRDAENSAPQFGGEIRQRVEHVAHADILSAFDLAAHVRANRIDADHHDVAERFACVAKMLHVGFEVELVVAVLALHGF